MSGGNGTGFLSWVNNDLKTTVEVTVALAVGFAAVLVSNLGDDYGGRVRIRQIR